MNNADSEIPDAALTRAEIAFENATYDSRELTSRPALHRAIESAWHSRDAEVERQSDLIRRLSKRIDGLREETERAGVCDCESYEPCYGECCGVGYCSCSMEVQVNA